MIAFAPNPPTTGRFVVLTRDELDAALDALREIKVSDGNFGVTHEERQRVLMFNSNDSRRFPILLVA